MLKLNDVKNENSKFFRFRSRTYSWPSRLEILIDFRCLCNACFEFEHKRCDHVNVQWSELDAIELVDWSITPIKKEFGRDSRESIGYQSWLQEAEILSTCRAADLRGVSNC